MPSLSLSFSLSHLPSPFFLSLWLSLVLSKLSVILYQCHPWHPVCIKADVPNWHWDRLDGLNTDTVYVLVKCICPLGSHFTIPSVNLYSIFFVCCAETHIV